MNKVPLHKSGEQYPEDVTRIRRAITHGGFGCSRQEAIRIWTEVSRERQLGWLQLGVMRDADILSMALDVIEAVE